MHCQFHARQLPSHSKSRTLGQPKLLLLALQSQLHRRHQELHFWSLHQPYLLHKLRLRIHPQRHFPRISQLHTMRYHPEQLCGMQLSQCMRYLHEQKLPCWWIWLIRRSDRLTMPNMPRGCIALHRLHTIRHMHWMCQALWTRSHWPMRSMHVRLPKLFKCLYAVSRMYGHQMD